MRWILLLIVLFPFSVYAGFCDTRASRSLPMAIEKIASDPAMRMGFKNHGGFANGGVCWWHSRFQRAAWYLANFDDSLPAPNAAAARVLIRKIISRKEVVTIPGYRDLSTFTRDFKVEIQRQLDAWQIRDALINQAYIRGLSGQSHFRDPDAMRARIESVFASYVSSREKGDVLFVMLQMQGIVSHASLIQAMIPEADGSYRIEMVDSNFPDEAVQYAYHPGDLDLRPADRDIHYPVSVPYAGFGRDLRRIHRAISKYCVLNFN